MVPVPPVSTPVPASVIVSFRCAVGASSVRLALPPPVIASSMVMAVVAARISVLLAVSSPSTAPDVMMLSAPG